MVTITGYRRAYVFEDGEETFFNEGKIDEWKVSLRKGWRYWSPRDVDYFNELYSLGERYGFEFTYAVFLYVCYSVYPCKWNGIDRIRFERVCKIADAHFEEDTLKLWMTLYLTMLAEENKKNTKLGKTIKNLAVYKILLLGEDIETVAGEMYGKRHYMLQEEMDMYGIVRVYEVD